MTRQFLILTLLAISLTSAGINRYEYINRKTNQYIYFSSSHNNKWTFTLITKKDSCVKNYITIFSDHLDIFIDSLRNVGFKKLKDVSEVTSDYKLKLSIDTCYFFKTIDGDSLFKFIYKYEVTDKNSIVFRHFQTEFVTETQKVKDGIKNKSFGFRAYKIRGTTIIDLTIDSLDIYNVNKKAHFQSGTAYSFFL